MSLRPLRPIQERGFHQLRQSLAGGSRRIVGAAPTGYGKTVLFAHIAQGVLNRGNRVHIVVPNISLVDQTVERLWENGITEVGVIQSMHPMTNYAKPVQVISAQTIERKEMRYIPHADLVVFDEVHEFRDFYEKWMDAWSNIPFIGLSATPWKKGLGEQFDTLIQLSTLPELMDAELLTPYRFFAMAKPDLKGVKVSAGDYNTKHLAERLNTRELVGDIVGKWKQHGENRPTLAFAVDRAHAKHIQQEFEAAGIPCGYIDSYTERPDRQLIAKQFARGELKVVSSVGCLARGIDWDVRCIILARSTKSEMLFTQMIGRGLRTAEGKDDCLVLDHSNTTLTLGFPHEIEARNQYLDDGKAPESSDSAAPDKEEAKPKECSSCGYIKAPKVHTCPACGFVPSVQTDVTEVSAELVELSAYKRKINRDYSPTQKGAFYAGLLWHARAKDYNPNWAGHKYREKFGVWPTAYLNIEPTKPNEQVVNHIKHLAMKRRFAS